MNRHLLPVLALLAGCRCGTATGYLPEYDAWVEGHEVCGAASGTFGVFDIVDNNVFNLFIYPQIRGDSDYHIAVNQRSLLVSLTAGDLVAGNLLHPDPSATYQAGGLPFTEAEIEILEVEEEEWYSDNDMSLTRLNLRLRWDVTWGQEDSGDFFLQVEAEDRVEASTSLM